MNSIELFGPTWGSPGVAPVAAVTTVEKIHYIIFHYSLQQFDQLYFPSID